VRRFSLIFFLISWQRWQWTDQENRVTHENIHSNEGTSHLAGKTSKNHRNEVKFHHQIIELAWRRTANNGFLLLIILFRKYCLAANCNSQFLEDLESKRRESKLLDLKIKNSIPFSKAYSVLCKIIKCLTSCARCDWSVRVHYNYSSIKHAAYVTRVLYLRNIGYIN